MGKIIYADNAATTKLDSDAFEAMKPWLLEEYGNASQPYSFSRRPKEALKKAREDADETFDYSDGLLTYVDVDSESYRKKLP